MLEQIGQRFEILVRRYMPDPFVLAVALTMLVFGAALIKGGKSPTDLINFWFNGADDNSGFWALLKFAMQMVLIVVTGEAVAAAPVVRKLLPKLASIPKTPRGAAAFVSFVAMSLGWLHWGFGLVAASLLAREVAAQARVRGVKIHYPLLGAAAYTAQLIWHGGLSGSAPLVVNSNDHFLFKQIGKVGFEQTVLTPMNLVACAFLLLTVPFIIAAMMPRADKCIESPDDLSPLPPAPAPNTSTALTPAERIDASPLPSIVIALIGGAALWLHFSKKGFDLNPNIVNFTFLLLGLLLHGSPVAYMKAAAASMRGAAGIVIQFPFYGGIMGLMLGSGIGHDIAEVFTRFASERTLPFFAYVCSVLSKLFIPSGGGEWAVEGPVMLKAAQELHANVGKTIMAVAYGNMVGNMFQPFWALPLLGIMGLKAREIMGYCLVIFCFACPVLGIFYCCFPDEIRASRV